MLCPGGSLGGKAGTGRRAGGWFRGVFVGAPAAELHLWGGSCSPVLADPCSGSPTLVSVEVTAEHLPSSLPWSLGCIECFPVTLEAPSCVEAFLWHSGSTMAESS